MLEDVIVPPYDPQELRHPGRKITGMSAILLPFTEGGRIDWESFEQHIERTAQAGLTPAVNMDTSSGTCSVAAGASSKCTVARVPGRSGAPGSGVS